jgi:hypothetical protein
MDEKDDDFYFDRLEYKNLTPEMERIQKLDRVPIVLYWNEYFSDEFQHFVPKEGSNIECPYKCKHTANRSLGAEVFKIIIQQKITPVFRRTFASSTSATSTLPICRRIIQKR